MSTEIEVNNFFVIWLFQLKLTLILLKSCSNRQPKDFLTSFINSYYPPTKSEGIVLAPSIPSTLFVRPEPYLSTYWSDLIHSWYKW